MAEPNGVECLECSCIVDGETDDTMECESCGQAALMQVTITPCPSSDDKCGDGDHHWGRGDHVVQKGT